MPQQIELSAEQLSALDQIIAQKQKGEAIINIAKIAQIVPVVVQVAQLTAQIAGGAVAMSTEDVANSPLKDVVKNIPVEQLIELRKNAIQKD